ncbi:terminase large subunit domain-containing protein [Methanobrevibacter sp.]|uniref:terminase large subunit domain-containing protein n=1 Tax=Methanobrevibacter sp. TaxID=66852 RepID=UPI00386ACFDC
MKVNFKIKLTNGQEEAYKLAHEKDTKQLVLVWSRQSGKSVFAEIMLIENLLKKNKFSAYISPTFQLGRKVYKEIVNLLDGKGIIKKANSSTLTIETITNSTLQFYSVESYTAIRGTTVNGVLICDEAAYYPDVLPNGENIWGNVIMPITKARQPLTIFISTPCGKQGFFYDFYLRALNGEDGIKYLERTIYDDNLVDKKQIEEIKRSIPPKAFEQEFMCKFLDSSLTFFQGFENCFVKDMQYNGTKEWIGVDLSGDGTDETIVTKVNDNNQVIQYKIEGTLDQKYRKIADIINQTNPVASYIENNGLGAPMINEIKKLVKRKSNIYEWNTSNSSKEEIISYLAVKVANKELYFNDSELYSQFGTFICKISKTKKLTFAAQEGKKDDRVMSLAIALRCMEDFKYQGINKNKFILTNAKRFI